MILRAAIAVLILGVEPTGDWRTLNRAGDVLVELQEHGKGVPDVRATTTIAAPVDQVLSVLEDVVHYRSFMPKVARSEVLGRTPEDTLVYLEYDAPWPASHRDSLGRYRTERTPTGASFSGEAVKDPRRPPRPGVIRLEGLRFRWLLTALPDGSTRVEYRYFADLGGNLPRFILERAWRDEPPLTFEALRKEVARRARP